MHFSWELNLKFGHPHINPSASHTWIPLKKYVVVSGRGTSGMKHAFAMGFGFGVGRWGCMEWNPTFRVFFFSFLFIFLHEPFHITLEKDREMRIKIVLIIFRCGASYTRNRHFTLIITSTKIRSNRYVSFELLESYTLLMSWIIMDKLESLWPAHIKF